MISGERQGLSYLWDVWLGFEGPAGKECGFDGPLQSPGAACNRTAGNRAACNRATFGSKEPLSTSSVASCGTGL